MEPESKVSVVDEAKDSDIFSRNSRITEILELVFDQSVTKKDMESILLNFWEKYDNGISEEQRFCEFDILCMYMLNCVYKRNGPTSCAVSRSIYCYLKHLSLSKENRIAIINGTKDDFVNDLREFTNFDSVEGEHILADALIKSLLDANFGLALFLLKFGLAEIPTEPNEKSKKLVENLVKRFNDVLQYVFRNEPAESTKTSIKTNELIDLMRESKVKFKRSLMTFFSIVAIIEYKLHEKTEVPFFKVMMRLGCAKKILCLYAVFEATTEGRVRFKDIETFIVNCLNPLLNADFGTSFVQFSRETLSKTFDPPDLRSLEFLARCTIRENLRSSGTFPEQVDKLNIPDDLKEFILYDCEGIFSTLKEDRSVVYFERAIKFLLDGRIPINLDY